MKSFFKSVFASMTGFFIAFGIIVVISGIMFFGFIGVLISSSSSEVYSLKDNTVLVINLTGEMKDRVTVNPLSEFFDLGDDPELGLSDILSAIKKAKNEKKIKGIYIRSGYFSAPNASILEIRNALEDFKSSGKFIISYADTYLQNGYFLSSVSDKVILNPEGNLDLHGLSMGTTFYKGLLDKVGVDIQIFKVGTYKSAVEPFTSDKMSDPNREQLTSIADNVWATMLDQISLSRDISVDKLNQLANEFPALKPTSFILENNLVDTTMYEIQVSKYLNTLLELDPDNSIDFASVTDMQTVKDRKSKKNKSSQIAVLYAEGSISSGNSSSDINDRYFVRQIEKLKEDDNIKAVVFRVNSRGGSAYASEQIWQAITKLKSVKPVVVSMGGYAASGGYYISCNADKIYAEPTTLTGSIGIYGMFPNAAGLVSKIGLTFDNVKTNKFADFGDITRPMTTDEKVILQQYIDRGYNLFLTRCSEGRNIPMDKMEKIAEGRVWTGEQALEIGLVDALGGIDDAVQDAASLADLDDFSVEEYPRKSSPFEEFFKKQKEEFSVKAMKSYLGSDFQLVKMAKDVKEMKDQDFIQARLVYDFEMK